MGNPIADQKAFMDACDQHTKQYSVSSMGIQLYTRLVDEEVDELFHEMHNVDFAFDNHENICKEIIDCIVVLLGLGYSYGYDMQKAWDIVHESNMQKVDPATGKVRRREDGKILKPEGWQKPDMLPALVPPHALEKVREAREAGLLPKPAGPNEF